VANVLVPFCVYLVLPDYVRDYIPLPGLQPLVGQRLKPQPGAVERGSLDVCVGGGGEAGGYIYGQIDLTHMMSLPHSYTSSTPYTQPLYAWHKDGKL